MRTVLNIVAFVLQVIAFSITAQDRVSTVITYCLLGGSIWLSFFNVFRLKSRLAYVPLVTGVLILIDFLDFLFFRHPRP